MDGRESVVIVGGGMGGMAAALALGRAGHPVTVLERDPLPARADAEEAFLAPRRGAPQVHQTHGFLARLQVVLGQRFPDVLAELLDRGAMRLATTADLGEPQPGDEDLEVVITRRTTLDWVLRSAVLAEASVEIRTDTAVAGLLVQQGQGSAPVVRGVRLDRATNGQGAEVEADVTVAATGRRDAVPAWLAEIGVDVPEVIHESGLMYLSRWYRLPEGFDIAQLDAKLGGDLGFVKYLGVPGDAGTLSITLAIRPEDRELRHVLSDPDGFEEGCRRLPGPDQFFRYPLRPVGEVRPMAGLVNRTRRYLDGSSRPTVLGFHAVGDAHTCTNPLYGRGCALALVEAVELADAMAAWPGDPAGRSVAYETACARQVGPWYELSVQMDKLGADPAGLSAGPADPNNPMTTILAAAATDPVLGRGFAKLWNLIATPAELAADPTYTARVAAVLAEPERYPAPVRVGPTRAEFLDALQATHA
ncbi:MAG TPA: FAD-dependent oxidoreductase [Acidimicrobiales bacterium]|nr:FAD-dependent oxidoreductase [Acidimicrobiales bacterium]